MNKIALKTQGLVAVAIICLSGVAFAQNQNQNRQSQGQQQGGEQNAGSLQGNGPNQDKFPLQGTGPLQGEGPQPGERSNPGSRTLAGGRAAARGGSAPRCGTVAGSWSPSGCRPVARCRASPRVGATYFNRRVDLDACRPRPSADGNDSACPDVAPAGGLHGDARNAANKLPVICASFGPAAAAISVAAVYDGDHGLRRLRWSAVPAAGLAATAADTGEQSWSALHWLEL